MSFKDKVISGLKWSTISNVGLALFQLLQMSILSRFLPKEAFGLIALSVLVVNFTNIFVEMGLTSAIFHKQNSTKNEYSSLYWFSIIIAVFLYFLLFTVSEPIAKFYSEDDLTMIIRILGLNIIFISIGKQHKALLQKKLEFDIVGKIDLFACLIGLITAISLAMYGCGVYSMVYSTLITSLLSSIILVYIRFKEDPIKMYFSIDDIRPFLKVGGYSLASSIFDYFSRQIDIILIGKLLGTQFLGIYSLAKQISLKAYGVMMPIIFNVFNPLLATLNEDKEKMERYFLKIVYIVTNITFPVYLAIILGASEILILLYGSDYSDGALTLVGLCVFQACFTVVKPAGSLQIATGRTDIGFLWTIFRIVITILVLYLAATFFDAKYIALFLGGLSTILVFFLWNIQIQKMSSIKFVPYIHQFIFSLIAFGVVVILKFALLDNLFAEAKLLVSIIGKIITGLLIYSVLLVILNKKGLLKTFNIKLLK